jgi:hypothetical protein
MKFVKLPNREFSFAVSADDIGSTPSVYEFAPNEEEAGAIAKRVGILALNETKIKAICTLESGHIIHVKGHFTAEITQECVVTLDSIVTSVSDTFEAWYSDQDHIASFKKAQHEAKTKREFVEIPMLEEHEDPEPLEDGKIDLGELFVQYLSLAINPYLHKEDVDLNDVAKNKSRSESDKQYAPSNPFAALKNWRPKD